MNNTTYKIFDVLSTLGFFAGIILTLLFFAWFFWGCSVTYNCQCKDTCKEKHEEIKGWYWGENEGVIRTKEKIFDTVECTTREAVTRRYWNDRTTTNK